MTCCFNWSILFKNYPIREKFKDYYNGKEKSMFFIDTGANFCWLTKTNPLG